MKIKNFNDPLALIIIVLVPLVIFGAKLLAIEIAGEILGTFTGGWILVLQYYFRAAPNPKS